MYGVPEYLDRYLSPFVGSQLQRIDLGKFIIHFRFAMDPEGIVSIEGHWELVDEAGVVIDHQQEPDERKSYRLHHLLLHDVTSFEVNAPEWFSLTFDNGMILKVYDASKQYESFSVQPGNIYV